MRFSIPHLPLRSSMDVTHMYSSAWRRDAKSVFVGSSIRKMLAQQVTCESMPSLAGGMMFCRLVMKQKMWRKCEPRSSPMSCIMGQLQHHSSVREKERSHTRIGNILVLKQSGSSSFICTLANRQSCRAELVRWVAESLRPFDIVKDRGFQSLMKTGRPEYYIASPRTISHDIRLVFARTRKRIAKMLGVSKVLFD